MWNRRKGDKEFSSCSWKQLPFIQSSVLFIDGACLSSVWPARKSSFICGGTVIVIAWLPNSTIRTLLIVSPHFDSSNDTPFSTSFCSLLNHSLHLALSFFFFFSFFTTEKESVNKGVKVVQICFLSWPRFSLSCYGVALWCLQDVYVIYKIFTRNHFIIPQVCCFIKSSNGSWSN